MARLERIFKFFLPQGLSSSVTFFEALDMIEAQNHETTDPALLQELKAILTVYHEQRFAFNKQDVEWNTLERRVKRLGKRLKGQKT